MNMEHPISEFCHTYPPAWSIQSIDLTRYRFDIISPLGTWALGFYVTFFSTVADNKCIAFNNIPFGVSCNRYNKSDPIYYTVNLCSILSFLNNVQHSSIIYFYNRIQIQYNSIQIQYDAIQSILNLQNPFMHDKVRFAHL